MLRCASCLRYHVYHRYSATCDALWEVAECPASYTKLQCAGCREELRMVPDDGKITAY